MTDAPPTILIVEDEPGLREVAVEALSSAGYTVLTAADGHEAVLRLVDDRVDLLLTDVVMPGMNGFMLAQQAKLIRPAVRVIYMTGYHEAAEHGAAPRHGTMMRKPFRIEQLLREIERALGA